MCGWGESVTGSVSLTGDPASPLPDPRVARIQGAQGSGFRFSYRIENKIVECFRIRLIIFMCGWGESNSRLLLGRQTFYH